MSTYSEISNSILSNMLGNSFREQMEQSAVSAMLVHNDRSSSTSSNYQTMIDAHREMINSMGGVTLRHLGQVKEVRKRFKEYSKEDFRSLSHSPLVKDILAGSHKLTGKEIADRIEENIKELL